MLRVSKLTDYATVVMTHIAHQPDGVHAASDITSATHLALPTVSKVLKLLSKASLLDSKRGANGGYVLSDKPQNISVASIIAAIEGPISMTECTVHQGVCEQESSCEIKANWSLINRAVGSALESVSLADLCKPVNQTVEVSVPVLKPQTSARC